MIRVGIIKASPAYLPVGSWDTWSKTGQVRYKVFHRKGWSWVYPIVLCEEKKADEPGAQE